MLYRQFPGPIPQSCSCSLAGDRRQGGYRGRRAGSEADLRHYGEVSDQLFSIEFEFAERHLAWLHAQCRGDWILRLDGDEIPSAEMVVAVLEARDDRQFASVLFARRHPFPTIERYIVQEPWYPDFQVRMVRNNGSLRVPGLQHSAAERTLPARIVEAPSTICRSSWAA